MSAKAASDGMTLILLEYRRRRLQRYKQSLIRGGEGGRGLLLVLTEIPSAETPVEARRSAFRRRELLWKRIFRKNKDCV